VVVVGKADWEGERELAAAGLGQDPAAHPGAQEMQFSFLCGLLRYADQSTGAPGGPR